MRRVRGDSRSATLASLAPPTMSGDCQVREVRWVMPFTWLRAAAVTQGAGPVAVRGVRGVRLGLAPPPGSSDSERRVVRRGRPLRPALLTPVTPEGGMT